MTEHNQQLTNNLNNHFIGGSFASSTFIADKLVIAAGIAQKF